jgi:hypothetical protein
MEMREGVGQEWARHQSVASGSEFIVLRLFPLCLRTNGNAPTNFHIEGL